MRLLKRIKEAADKLIFCYTATKNLSSFFKLIWFTKFYRFRKKSIRYKKYQNKFFSIFLNIFPGREIFLRIYAGDIDIFYEIFYKKIYELPYTSTKQVIIDAGANVGFASLYFLCNMPNAIIYCIEPDPDNFIFLQKNLQAEICNERVIPIQAALAFKDGSMTLKKSHFKYNTGITEDILENSMNVTIYSVTTFLKKFNIEKVNLLKIDIEGAEERIFKGDISWLNNVSEILIEFHSEEIKKMCFEKLASQKLNFFPYYNRLNTDVFHFTR
jgi:FkbM family methyltransferase